MRDRTGAAKKGYFLCGTDGSNPSPSSEESSTNQSRRTVDLLSGDILHVDDTPVPVLMPGTGKTKTGWLWAYVPVDGEGFTSLDAAACCGQERDARRIQVAKSFCFYGRVRVKV